MAPKHLATPRSAAASKSGSAAALPDESGQFRGFPVCLMPRGQARRNPTSCRRSGCWWPVKKPPAKPLARQTSVANRAQGTVLTSANRHGLVTTTSSSFATNTVTSPEVDDRPRIAVEQDPDPVPCGPDLDVVGAARDERPAVEPM